MKNISYIEWSQLPGWVSAVLIAVFPTDRVQHRATHVSGLEWP